MASIWQVVLRHLGVRCGEMLAMFLLHKKKRLISRHPCRLDEWKVPPPASRSRIAPQIPSQL